MLTRAESAARKKPYHQCDQPACENGRGPTQSQNWHQCGWLQFVSDKIGVFASSTRIFPTQRANKNVPTRFAVRSSRLQHVQDDQRRRIARDLHDNGWPVSGRNQDERCTVGARRPYESQGGGVWRKRKRTNYSTHASRRYCATSYLLHSPMLDESGLASRGDVVCGRLDEAQ